MAILKKVGDPLGILGLTKSLPGLGALFWGGGKIFSQGRKAPSLRQRTFQQSLDLPPVSTQHQGALQG